MYYFKKAAGSKLAVLVLVLVALCALCACGQQKEESPWEHGFELHPEQFGVSRESYAEDDDLQGCLQDLYKICANQPETLASTMSAFPDILERVGLRADTPAQEIDDYMSEDEYGGVLQTQLLGELRKLVNDSRTDARFTERSGKANMYYMYTVDNEQASSPANIRLILIPTTVMEDSYVCLEITPRNSDDTGIFYLAGGFQRIVP